VVEWHIVNGVIERDATLDNPTWSALTGPQAGLAERKGRALRFQPDFCPFYGVPDEPTAQDWADAAALAGPGGLVTLAATWIPFPEDWELAWAGEGVQLVAGGEAGHDDVAAEEEIVRLGPADAAQALDLVERTRPGPFQPRTIELGAYLGIRRAGALVAMAGERLHLDGYTEVSAVCTDPAWRGHGFASRLTLAIAAGIRERGEIPFLHAVATNRNAIRLYEQLGFELRRTTMFKTARVPG
jgi:ribosomal protein S18 acetylase RimI-like enzyme